MSDSEQHRLGLMRMHLEAFVGLRILELKRMTPTMRAVACDWDISRARDTPVMHERVDILFGPPQIGAQRTRKDLEDSAQIMDLLVKGVAALAMSAPGGITVLGLHWCADHQACEAAEQTAAAQ